jgi:hypothetical protein
MKEIKIDKYGLPDYSSVYIKQKQYSIFLGNETWYHFDSLKDTKCFLAETNRFLNDCIHELNYLYAIIFTEYRNNWFYFKSNLKIEDQIWNSFELIHRNFSKAVSHSQSVNGNVFTFNYLFNICTDLQQVLSHLEKVLCSRHNFGDVRKVKAFEKQIKLINNELHDYGKYIIY